MNPRARRLLGAARGVTLIEMMIVAAILGIIAAIAVPNVTPIVHRQKLTGGVEEVANLLDRARRKAFNEGRCYRVRMVGSTLVTERKGGTRAANCVGLGSASWDAALQTVRPEPGIVFALDATSGTAIIFRPSGRLRGDGDATVTDDGAQVRVEHATLGIGYAVKVTPLGRICRREYAVGSPPTVTGALTCP